MSKISILGHQNPDSDAIGSSIAYVYLKRKLGVDARAVTLGAPDEEATFALSYFSMEAPRAVESAKAEGADQVILIDHNKFQQSISDIRDVEVIEVVDHCRTANFETANPLYMHLESADSASSTAYRLYEENNIVIPREMIDLLLSGLILNTLLLESPTTHATDPAAAADLAGVTGVNLEEYGLTLLKAGANLATKSAEGSINIDAKTFELNGNWVCVAQVNTIGINEVLEYQAGIEATITAAGTANNYSGPVLMITDILNLNSETLAFGSNVDKAKAAFGFKFGNDHAFLAGAVSHKKQVVPQLTEGFNI